MLRTQQIINEKELVRKGLIKRNYDQEGLQVLDQVIDLDQQRKNIQSALDIELAARNSLSKTIGSLLKNGQKEEAEAQKQQIAAIKVKADQMQVELKTTKSRIEELLFSIPNVPHASVIQGKGEEDNEVTQDWNQDLPNLPDGYLPHWELAKKYNLIDFELGAKITGSGFPLYRGKGAKLQRALINYFLDRATKAGYEEVIPPLLVNEDTARGTGQLPDKEGQMYHATADDLYLIPTAEVPITNIYRDQILKEGDFPIKMTGYTPCFRREAGSYGSDVKGLNRVHQFDKIEIVRIEHPKNSYQVLDEMVHYVQSILEELNLPFRILRLCGGDLGFTSALTYDFEVYSAGQDKWLEVSSVSNFETFQSNRLKLRFKTSEGKTELAHTLNGSALALPRIVAALLENNQTSEGIEIPEALIPFTGFERIS